MKQIIASLIFFLIFIGCSTKSAPMTDVSNAKMALIKAEGKNAKVYSPQALSSLKKKFQHLQTLMQSKKYEEAKFLAQKIQADARVLEKKSERIKREKVLKALQGEINLIKKEFISVQE